MALHRLRGLRWARSFLCFASVFLISVSFFTNPAFWLALFATAFPPVWAIVICSLLALLGCIAGLLRCAFNPNALVLLPLFAGYSALSLYWIFYFVFSLYRGDSQPLWGPIGSDPLVSPAVLIPANLVLTLIASGMLIWGERRFVRIERQAEQSPEKPGAATPEGGRSFQLATVAFGVVFAIFLSLIVPAARGFVTDNIRDSSNDSHTTYPTLWDVWIENDLALAVGAKGTLMRSENAGMRWARVNTNIASEASLTAIHAFPKHNLFFVTGDNGLLLRSADVGKTWQQVSRPDPDRKLLAFAALDDGRTLFAGGHGLLLRSVDAGLSWHRLDAVALDGLNLSSIVSGPGRRVLVLASQNTSGEAGQLLQSLDGGQTWAQIGESISRLGMQQLRLDTTSGALYAYGHSVAARSTDLGQHWQIPLLSVPSEKQAATFAQAKGWLRLVTRDAKNCSRIQFSLDEGSDWQDLGCLPNHSNTAAVLTLSGGRVLLMGTGGHSAYSDDGGNRWQIVESRRTSDGRANSGEAPLPHVNRFVASADGRIILAQTADAVYRSLDLGQSWEKLRGGFRSQLSGIALRADGAVAVVSGGGLFLSSDQGKTWTMVGREAFD